MFFFKFGNTWTAPWFLFPKQDLSLKIVHLRSQANTTTFCTVNCHWYANKTMSPSACPFKQAKFIGGRWCGAWVGMCFVFDVEGWFGGVWTDRINLIHARTLASTTCHNQSLCFLGEAILFKTPLFLSSIATLTQNLPPSSTPNTGIEPAANMMHKSLQRHPEHKVNMKSKWAIFIWIIYHMIHRYMKNLFIIFS